MPGQHEPGAEFESSTGRVEPESDASDEIDTASNQSPVPSSVGMTFCADSDIEHIEIKARRGQYERVSKEEYEVLRKDISSRTFAIPAGIMPTPRPPCI